MLDLGYWNIGYQMLGCKLFIWFVQKLPVNNFQWIIKDTAQFNEDLKKNYNEEIDMKIIFLKLMFNIFKNYMNFIMIYHF